MKLLSRSPWTTLPQRLLRARPFAGQDRVHYGLMLPQRAVIAVEPGAPAGEGFEPDHAAGAFARRDSYCETVV